MSNRRIEKKKTRRLLKRRALEAANLRAPYDPRTRVVAVPCPRCAHPTVERTTIPELGNINGSVRCPRCRLVAPFLTVLARAMVAEDPLPPAYYQAPQHAPIDLSNTEMMTLLHPDRPRDWRAAIATFVGAVLTTLTRQLAFSRMT